MSGLAGVVPEVAARAHVERILPCHRLGHSAPRGIDPQSELEAIAVADRPGLAGSLSGRGCRRQDAGTSRGESRLVSVNHLHAHLYACQLSVDFLGLPLCRVGRQRRPHESLSLRLPTRS